MQPTLETGYSKTVQNKSKYLLTNKEGYEN